MKLFHFYILLLKIAFAVQLFLIFFKKESVNDPVYYWTDHIFNTSLGLFLIYFFYVNKFTDLDTSDRYFLMIIGFIFLFNTWQTEIFEIQSIVYDKVSAFHF